MKLTISENRDAIRRYAHVRPVSRFAGDPCGVRCPGTWHRCSLKKGHTGIHVAHGLLRRVVAVWDEDARATAVVTRRGPPGALERWAALGQRLIPGPEKIEAAFLLAFGLGMTYFCIEWVIRIIAGE